EVVLFLAFQCGGLLLVLADDLDLLSRRGPDTEMSLTGSDLLRTNGQMPPREQTGRRRNGSHAGNPLDDLLSCLARKWQTSCRVCTGKKNGRMDREVHPLVDAPLVSPFSREPLASAFFQRSPEARG